jgi:hypothetical protein
MSRVQSDFSIALMQLKKGNTVRRESWQYNLYLEIHETSEGADIALNDKHGPVYRWIPKDDDLLATDWVQL